MEVALTLLISGDPSDATVMSTGSDIDCGELRTLMAKNPASMRSAPLITAVSDPSLLNVVGCSTFLKMTFDVGRNPLPLMRSVGLSEPRTMVDGSMLSIAGRRTVSVAGADVVPLSVTVIWSWPYDAISLAATVVISAPVDGCCDVECVTLLMAMIDVGLKLLPLTVSWNPPSPEMTVSGEIDRSEEHTSELQSHSFISYAVFCFQKKIRN